MTTKHLGIRIPTALMHEIDRRVSESRRQTGRNVTRTDVVIDVIRDHFQALRDAQKPATPRKSTPRGKTR